jgi:hypothetical protein
MMKVHAETKVEKIEYKGWRNCYRVSNGLVELLVTGDVGPRIIRYGFVGSQNLFLEFACQMGKSGEAEFQARGGHRIWKAPEDSVATWAPDNDPVEIAISPDGLVARAPIEPTTLLQKEIAISISASGSKVIVSHRIANRSLFALEFAPWALTMMASGGVAIAGFPPRGRYPVALNATNPLVMWAYSDLADKRWTFTRKYLLLRHDPGKANAQKLGLFNPDTWAVYLLKNEAFVKWSKADVSKTYTDFGCSFEMFTNDEFLELETLGPVSKVLPGQSVEHIEHWSLHRNVELEKPTDDAIDRSVLPLVQSTRTLH